MSASKIKGTRWESACVAALIEHGAIHAERRAMSGAADRGDIAGVPGVVFECKSEARSRLAAYIDEAEAERINDKSNVGLVWMKQPGKTAGADGIIVATGDVFARLLFDGLASLLMITEASRPNGWEAACAGYLRDRGVNVRGGGRIAVVFRAKAPAALRLHENLSQVDNDRKRLGVDIGAVAIKIRGRGIPERAAVAMRARDCLRLLAAGGYLPSNPKGR